jgi:cobalt-zinc-cadmium efflux system membrane fusion protein
MKPRLLLTALCLFLFSSTLVLAGDGHDHGDAPPAASGSGPKRQPDGSVFLPKPAQRQIGVRTLLVELGELPRTHELAGKVVMDPNAGGKVQAIVAGRVTPGPRGLPLPGQAVKKGEVLAYVTPEVGGNSRSLAESRLRRLRELSDTVPRKLIEEAKPPWPTNNWWRQSVALSPRPTSFPVRCSKPAKPCSRSSIRNAC